MAGSRGRCEGGSSCDFVFSSRRAATSDEVVEERAVRSRRCRSGSFPCASSCSGSRRHRPCGGGGHPRGSPAGRGAPADRPGRRAAGGGGGAIGAAPGRAAGAAAKRAFDDLVQLAPVQPDAAAFRAIVDLDPAAISHHQRFVVHRAAHRVLHSRCSPLDGVANAGHKGRKDTCANCRDSRRTRGEPWRWRRRRGVCPDACRQMPASVLYAGTFRGSAACAPRDGGLTCP